jgi:hypothetical protein
MYYHAPLDTKASLNTKEELLAINPSTVGIATGFGTAIWAVPAGALAFGLIGLIFSKAGKGALAGAGAGAGLAAIMGVTMAIKTRKIQKNIHLIPLTEAYKPITGGMINTWEQSAPGVLPTTSGFTSSTNPWDLSKGFGATL